MQDTNEQRQSRQLNNCCDNGSIVFGPPGKIIALLAASPPPGQALTVLLGRQGSGSASNKLVASSPENYCGSIASGRYTIQRCDVVESQELIGLRVVNIKEITRAQRDILSHYRSVHF